MKKLYLIFFIILFVSCNKATIENKIYEDIKDSNNSKIDFKDYTDFKWDTVYVFQTPTNLENINKVIKTEYKNYIEFTRPIIFIKNGKIVYSENNQSNVESLIEGQLVYKDLMNTVSYVLITKDNSVFTVKILKENNLDYVLFK